MPAYEDLYRNPPAVFLILIMTMKFTPRLTADRLRGVGLDELLDDWQLQQWYPTFERRRSCRRTFAFCKENVGCFAINSANLAGTYGAAFMNIC